MYRKADRERLERIEQQLVLLHDRAEFEYRHLGREITRMSDGQDKLIQSHAALEKQLAERLEAIERKLMLIPDTVTMVSEGRGEIMGRLAVIKELVGYGNTYPQQEQTNGSSKSKAAKR